MPLLRQSGAGSVIQIGGLTAHTGAARRAHVVTAKAALGGLTRALAHELAGHGITVNCVAPGMIDTVRNSASALPTPRIIATARCSDGAAGPTKSRAQWCGSQARAGAS